MKNKITSKLMFCVVAFTALAGMMLMTGCDPQKIGGGGLMQSFSRATGQYK